MSEVPESLTDRLKREAEERKTALQKRWDEAPRPPSIRALCLDHTLYAPIQLSPQRDADYWLKALRFEPAQFDCYCVYCGRDSVFRTFANRTPDNLPQLEKIASMNLAASEKIKRLILEDGQFVLHLSCTRNHAHLYSYFFSYNEREGVLIKIGQTPSLEDVAGADIERYRRILGDEFSELRKATGLFAHGIGIGSFVYLRRIFEGLVGKAQKVADPNGERAEEFARLRMAERIAELADYLPPAVVKFKEAYGILSTGLHELTEEDCKKHFPVVRAAIIAMLEQRYEADEKAKATAALERAVAAAASEAKGR